MYFFHSGSLLNGFTPADGNTSKSHLSFCDISKLRSKFTRQLDGNYWNDQWATGSIITLPQFNSLIIFSPPPTLCQCLLFIYSLHPLLSFLFFDNLISQICDCHREMSHRFQPLPSFHPVLPPPFSSPPFLFLFPLSFDSLWVATVSWDTVSSLTLTPGKLFPLASQPQLNCCLPPSLSPFCFHLLLLLQRLCSCIINLALLSGAIMDGGLL